MLEPENQKPWYRQLWPWILIAIPGSSVIGGVVMIYLAITGSDHLVKDSYYKDGMAINRQLDRDILATKLGVEASIEFDVMEGVIFVILRGVDEYGLVAELFHPTDSARDLKSTLFRENGEKGMFQGSFGAPLDGRWYLELRDLDNEWRLRGRVILPATGAVVIKPTAV
ncbi:MAG: FixH family protein [Gammaproteobacteria bacterium]|nr:FixH family protein [Gammaproteobacteria bacterium]